jgi:tetratricopeptide (TPR) repeat protein
LDHDAGPMVAEPREHEAVEKARARLEQQKLALGERHPDYASGLNQLALLMIMYGDPAHAEPLLRQALGIREETLGERHPDYATNLSSLAGLLWARGDLDGAEPLLRRALEIRWDVLGANHPKSVVSLHSLEQLLKAKREWDEAPPSSEGDDPEPPAPLGLAPETTAERPEETNGGPADVEASEHESATPPPDDLQQEDTATAAAEAVADGGHATVTDCDVLSRRVEALAREFTGVGRDLAVAAESMRDRGPLPPEALVARLDACSRGFAGLREQVLRVAEGLGVPETDVPGLGNLDEIGTTISLLAEVEARRSKLATLRDRALGVLDRVLALRHADRPDFAPLSECQERARALRLAIEGSDLASLPGDAAALAEGPHPFSALLRLAGGGEGLSDDLWAESRDVIEAAFGRALSVAAARSRIV